jgi:hypothetical protein
MKKNTFGDMGESFALLNSRVVDAGISTDTVWSIPIPIEHMDGVSAQLISGGARDLTIYAADHVVKATKTWTFNGGNFTAADVGGTFTIAGTTGAANDGTYTIESVTDQRTVVSVEAVPGANETFDPLTVTVSLIQNSPQGTWTFRISNSYSQGTSTKIKNDGNPWTPMLASDFSPSIAAVTEQFVANTRNSANQPVQCAPFLFRAFQVGFTPAVAGGAGPVSAYVFNKGNS